MLASREGHTKVVKVLLDTEGAKVNLQTTSGDSALMMASENGHVQVVEQLLQHGAEVDMKEHTLNDTALIFACRNGHIEVVSILIECNAQIDFQNEKGTTPLMVACAHNQVEVVRLLLNRGASESLEDKSGDSAADCALVAGIVSDAGLEVLKLLLDAGIDASQISELLILACLFGGKVELSQVSYQAWG